MMTYSLKPIWRKKVLILKAIYTRNFLIRLIIIIKYLLPTSITQLLQLKLITMILKIFLLKSGIIPLLNGDIFLKKNLRKTLI
nr:hypothetical protein GZ9D8_6 [uncultured archaeon GZfos9D8]